MRFFFVLLLLIPAIEIALFIEAGSRIGTLNTILLILTTAAIGVALIRQQGLQTLFRARTKMSYGEVPAYEMLEGMFLVVAGILLLTPGFFTDSIGFLLLLPALRRKMIAKVTHMSSVNVYTTTQSDQHRTIEGELDHKDKTD